MTGRFANLVLPGTELEAKPLTDRKAPVVVRVAAVHPHGTAFRYDIEYFGLEPGTHDLRDSLRRKDGSSAADLPPIPIRVNPVRPPGQVEPNDLAVAPGPRLGGYRLLVIGLGVLWGLGLVAIVLSFFFPRRPRPAAADAGRPLTLADRLRPLVEGAVAGRLSTGELADLERALMAYWRKRLRLEAAPPAEAIAALRRHPDAGPLLNRLEEWLHRPGPSAAGVDVGALLAPYRNLPPDALELDGERRMKDIPLVWPTFTQPLVLFGLLLPGLLLAWVWAGRWLVPARRVVLPLDRARAGGGWWWWVAISLAESVPPLLLAVAVCVLAGPQRNGPPQDKRSVTNIQFAVDVSGSMVSTFGDGTRYDASMEAINKFLEYRKGDAFGLTFFGVAFVHWVPLTTDPSAIKCAPPFMRPEVAPAPFGGTAIGAALTGCKQELARRASEGDKMIVLISDGDSFDLMGNEADYVRQLSAEGIAVFAIIVGGHEPQDEVYTICRQTGGEAFRADDPEALPAVFRKIDTLKQARITPTIAETVDYYEPFALAGAALLLAGTLALYGLRYTPW
jgi:Ca-activated chloride channel family protein